MVGDSTNAPEPGHSGSESDVREGLTKLIGQIKSPGTIYVACFSSNLARLDSVAHAANRAGRTACVLGRSLISNYELARESGFLTSFEGQDHLPMWPEAKKVDPDKRVVIVTGCQGETNSALQRIAEGTHQFVNITSDVS